MKKMTPETTIVFADVETTGIDGPDKDPLLEVAIVITVGATLTPIAEKSWLTLPEGMTVAEARAIAASKRKRGDFDVEAMHVESGLWDDLESAETILTYAEVDDAIDEFLTAEVGDADGLLLGGNSQGFDRGYFSAHLPKFNARLSYRNFDGTSVAYFTSGLGAAIQSSRTGVTGHRGIADLHLCINDVLIQRDAIQLAATAVGLAIEVSPDGCGVFAPDAADDVEWYAALVRLSAVLDSFGYRLHIDGERRATILGSDRYRLQLLENFGPGLNIRWRRTL